MKAKGLIALMVIVCCATFSACSKKGSDGGAPTPTPGIKKKYLTRVIRVETASAGQGGGITTNITDYSYDSKKRLISSKSGAAVTNYVYYDDGNLYTVTNGSGGNRSVYEFSYAEGKLKSYTLKVYQNNVLTTDRVYDYVYNGDKVTEIHFELYYAKYTYDNNGNITRIFNYGEPQYTTVYEYDNKKNKFFDSPFKYPTVGDIAGDRFNPNNRTVRTTEGLNPNVKTTILYNYDSDGYPTGASESADYAASSTFKYSYTYSTLD